MSDCTSSYVVMWLLTAWADGAVVTILGVQVSRSCPYDWSWVMGSGVVCLHVTMEIHSGVWCLGPQTNCMTFSRQCYIIFQSLEAFIVLHGLQPLQKLSVNVIMIVVPHKPCLYPLYYNDTTWKVRIFKRNYLSWVVYYYQMAALLYIVSAEIIKMQ